MDAIALMATAMRAAQARLDVSASNLANVSSEGFHKRLARTSLTPRGVVTAARVDDAQGPLERTGRPFDLALVGRGGFSVRDATGRTSSTRDGAFEHDPHGRLVDARGRALLGAHGPLVVGANATIDARGVVRDGDAIVGRLRLPAGASVRSGFLERANVDAVGEMVDVLGAQRAFESAQKTLSALDEERRKTVADVARVAS
jgi:flagellar basal body rod protein FlgG